MAFPSDFITGFIEGMMHDIGRPFFELEYAAVKEGGKHQLYDDVPE
jgi:hypothetical protein